VPVVSLQETLGQAFAGRYGVPAINVIDDLSISAVLAAAVQERSPIILQTSVKTVQSYGRDQLFGVFSALVRDVDVPVSLHLDHCPDRAVISACLDGGWNSVLFDAHELDVAENLRQTSEVVREARRHGASVEGEIEAIQGVEDDLGSDEASVRQSLEVAVDFIQRTGVECFAPAIGLSDTTFSRLVMLADELEASISVPLHQSFAEIESCLATHGQRPLERLWNAGLLTPASTAPSR